MTSVTSPGIAELTAHLREIYGVHATSIALVPGRAHAEAIPYRIESDGGVYFLKLTAGSPGAGLELARYLADAGIREVLAPVRALDGNIAPPMGDLSLVLYPFLEGENGFRSPLTAAQWNALGAALQRVHEARPPGAITDRLRVERFSGVWRQRATERLDAIKAVVPRDDVARALTALLNAKRAEIEALIRNAEHLAASLLSKALPHVPCHADIHGGNVLIDRSGALFIVDWDDPVLAPKERDLMFVGAGIGGVWNRPEEATAFYRGYGTAAVDGEAIAYYRCDRIVEDIVLFHDRLLLESSDDIATRQLVFEKLAAAFDPRDVVDIALRTVETL